MWTKTLHTIITLNWLLLSLRWRAAAALPYLSSRQKALACLQQESCPLWNISVRLFANSSVIFFVLSYCEIVFTRYSVALLSSEFFLNSVHRLNRVPSRYPEEHRLRSVEFAVLLLLFIPTLGFLSLKLNRSDLFHQTTPPLPLFSCVKTWSQSFKLATWENLAKTRAT